MSAASSRMAVTILGAVAIGAAAIGLGLFGWRSRLVDLDMLPFVYDALALLQQGTIPVKGSVLSMGAHSPPLSAWLYAPGVAMFDHPALFSLPGTGTLFVLTLVGIVLLVGPEAGAGCALLAACLFAFSKTGQHFTLFVGSWTFFVVWAVYFWWLWVSRRNGRFLAAGLFVWSLGMNNMMIIAPLILALPVLWLVYRPPISWRSLVIAAAATFVLWSPYLLHEWEQGFRGLWAQLSRQSVIPPDFERSWCDADLRPRIEAELGGLDLTGQRGGPEVDDVGGGVKWLAVKVASRISVVTLWLTGNLQLRLGDPVVDAVVGLVLAAALLMVVASALTLELEGIVGRLKRMGTTRWMSPVALRILGLVAVVVGVAVNEVSVVRLFSRDGHLWADEIGIIRQFQAGAFLAGVVLVFHTSLGRLARRLAARTEWRADALPGRDFLRFLAYTYLVPGVALLVVAAPGRGRYFFPLWPLQCVLLAIFTVHVLPRVVALRWVQTAGAVVLLVLVCWKPIHGSLWGWYRSGYHGTEPGLLQAVDHVGEAVRGEGRTSAAIGYQLPFPGFHISYNVVDPRYKVGAVADFLLRLRHGIRNENLCAEGIRPGDEYRIVAQRPTGRSASVYLDLGREGDEEVAAFPGVRVFRLRAP